MYQLSRTFATKVLNFLLAIAIVVALLGAVYDFSSSLKSGGNDLRNRVVGARLLIEGIDPYYYRWQPGDPETFLDPLDKLELPVSRVTVPPTGLALYIPFAKLPYLYQRLIWFFLQWGAILLSLFLLLKRRTETLSNRFLLGYGLFFITGSLFWRLHLQTGQLYVFYAFLIATSYWISSKKTRFSEQIAGLLIGMAASIRFPILVMILPMLLFKKFKLLVATLLGFVLSIGVTWAAFGHQTWVSYFSAMQTISHLSQGVIKVPAASQNSAISKVVEGMVFGNQSASADKLPAENLSVMRLLDHLFDIHISTGHLLAGLLLALLSYLLILHRSYKQTERQFRPPVLDTIFISGGLMLFLADLVIPAPRYSYNDIQLLVPLILLLKNIDFYDVQSLCLFLLLCLGLLVAGGLFPWLPYEILLGQFLMLAVLLLMSLRMKSGERKPVEVPKPSVPLHR
jgi:hypothetical protein